MKSRGTLILSAMLLVMLGVCYTWATWQFFTRPIPGGNDFLTHYGAWQAYWRDGVSPYSDAAALNTQRAIYGRLALPGEDQNRMVYPFYSILIHGPFALIEDYALARAVYMTVSQIALLIGVVMCVRLFRWKPSVGLLAGVLAWTLLYYHDARGVLIGQFAILAFGALAVGLVLLQQKQDTWAGVALAFTTIKPTLVFLVVPFLLGWCLVRRRWNFAVGFLAALTVVGIGSFIALPTWFGDWVYRVLQYTGYTQNQSPVWTIAQMGPIVTFIYLGALALLLLWSWRQSFYSGDDHELYWALGLTLVVSNLVSPRAATTDYVLMLVPTLGFFAALDRAPRWGRFTLVALMLGSMVGLWALHLATVQGDWEQWQMYLPWPLALLAIWILGRRWLITSWRNLVHA